MKFPVLRRTGSRGATSLFLAVLFSTAVLTGCGGEELKSTWRDREVVIDGMIGTPGEVDREWAGARTALEDENASVGLINDGEYLYMSLVLGDLRLQRQVVGMGLTVWFDSNGGKDRTFGIRFPLGARESGFPMAESGMPSFGRPGAGNDREDGDFEAHLQETLEAMTQLEILGPGESDRQKLHVHDAGEIDVEVGTSDGALVYELKIPLAGMVDHPHAIGAEPGSVIGVRLETPKIDMSAMRDQMKGRGRGGGGMPGGGMRGGGMPGGDMRGVHPEMPESLNVWAKIHLASIQESSGNVEDETSVSVISVEK